MPKSRRRVKPDPRKQLAALVRWLIKAERTEIPGKIESAEFYQRVDQLQQEGSLPPLRDDVDRNDTLTHRHYGNDDVPEF